MLYLLPKNIIVCTEAIVSKKSLTINFPAISIIGIRLIRNWKNFFRYVHQLFRKSAKAWVWKRGYTILLHDPPIVVENSFTYLVFFLASCAPFVPLHQRTVKLHICQPFAVNVKFRATKSAVISVKADTKYKPRTCIGFHAVLPTKRKNL